MTVTTNVLSTAPRWPSYVAVVLGALMILALEGALFSNVLGYPGPQGATWWWITMLVRANMTPLAWSCYIVLCLGLLSVVDGVSWLRRFRNRFWLCWLWSVPAWCFFDWINFYFMRNPEPPHWRAWEYINLPPEFADRLIGYLVAFGAIAPGMFLSAELLMRAGFRRCQTRAVPIGRGWIVGVFLLGIPLALVPFVVGGPISNLALWVGTFAVLDPINLALGRPSILGDWRRGAFGRTLALGAGGLLCGFLWEFWNYWALTKWVYHLPFLGQWEQYRYFEMPVPGLIGFIAFGIETWVMWQTTLLILAPCVEGERTAEDQDRGRELCF